MLRPRADDASDDTWLWPTADPPSLTVYDNEPDYIGTITDGAGTPLVDVFAPRNPIGFGG